MSISNKLYSFLEGREIAQLVKFLPWKYQDLSSIPRTYVKLEVAVQTQNIALKSQRLYALSGLLGSRSSQRALNP